MTCASGGPACVARGGRRKRHETIATPQRSLPRRPEPASVGQSRCQQLLAQPHAVALCAGSAPTGAVPGYGINATVCSQLWQRHGGPPAAPQSVAAPTPTVALGLAHAWHVPRRGRTQRRRRPTPSAQSDCACVRAAGADGSSQRRRRATDSDSLRVWPRALTQSAGTRRTSGSLELSSSRRPKPPESLAVI